MPGAGLKNPHAFGFRFVIYTLDHEPAHVHVTGPGHAKINLLGPDGAPELVASAGIKRPDLRRLLAEVWARRDDFQATTSKQWEHIHGRSD